MPQDHIDSAACSWAEPAGRIDRLRDRLALTAYVASIKDRYQIEIAYDEGTRFIDQMAVYTDEFFQEGTLILILVQEPSGSIRHTVDSVRLENNSLGIAVTRHVPENGTDDMAQWHLFIALPKDRLPEDVTIQCELIRDPPEPTPS